MQAPEINIDKSVILPRYEHLIDEESSDISIEFLYGGRDSSKSYTTAEILIIECISMSYFRCALIREQSGDIKDSQWQLIKDIVNDWCLEKYFDFRKAPLEIECNLNQNKFIARGCNEPQNLKSITACNRAWIEEGVLDRESMTIILGTIRSNKSKVKVFYTFNPECEGDYHKWWIYEDWFEGYWSVENLSFSAIKEFVIKVPNKKDKIINLKYRVTHSTYHDNPHISDERIAFHENNRGYYYTVYTLGLFGYKITGDEFLPQFSAAKHTANFTWNSSSTLHVCVDSNTAPYVTISLWQVDEDMKLITQPFELPCRTPHNSATRAARKLSGFLNQLKYEDVIFLYGDATANNASTIDENNKSFFDKFIEELVSNGWHIENRISKSNPRVALSGDFMNDVLENNYEGWNFLISKNCSESIEDYTMSKKNKEGGILKKLVTNKETKVQYQERGHLLDCWRYVSIALLSEEFQKYGNRKKRGMVMVARGGSKFNRRVDYGKHLGL